MKKLIIGVIIFMFSCTSSNDFEKAKKQLQREGYTNINQGGYAIFCCGEDDTFKTRFSAIDPDGNKVEGCICSGVLKGMTIRYD